MLPCKRVINSKHSAKFLKMAEGIARSLRGGYAVKRRVIDGCLIEGKKTGKLLSASSLETEGLFSFLRRQYGADQNMFRFRCSPTRDALGADGELLFPALRNPEVRYLFVGTSGELGSVVESSGVTVNQSENNCSLIDYYRTTTGVFIRLLSFDALTRENSMTFVHSSVVDAAGGGFKIGGYTFGRASFLAGVVFDGVRYAAVSIRAPVGKAGEDGPMQYQQRLMVLSVKDASGGHDVTFDIFNQNSLPSEIVPSFVEHYADGGVILPAATWITATDMESDGNGGFLISFKYRVQVTDSSPNPDNGGSFSIVEAHGVFSYAPGRISSISVHSYEVESDHNSSLIPLFGLSHDVQLFGDDVALLDGVAARPVGVFARDYRNKLGVGTLTGDMSLELRDGVPVGAPAGIGPMATAGVAVHNGSKATVGEGSYVLPRSQLLPAGGGVLFVFGSKARFELVFTGSSYSGGTYKFLAATCPQIEVRDSSGKLTTPATIIVSYTLNDVRFVAKRVGPIWPEDGLPDDPTELWSVVPSPYFDDRAVFYLGSDNTGRKYGHLLE